MTQKADIGSKRLVSLDPQGWTQWVTGNTSSQVFTLFVDRAD
ncbi:MAG: hypothetical protein Q6L60_11805 [Thermostichus sp. HHBFW_bins_43]